MILSNQNRNLILFLQNSNPPYTVRTIESYLPQTVRIFLMRVLRRLSMFPSEELASRISLIILITSLPIYPFSFMMAQRAFIKYFYFNVQWFTLHIESKTKDTYRNIKNATMQLT